MSVLSDKLALRYFKKRIISWLAVVAVAVSVFITLVVMTVMNGLANEFKEKNHRLFGDCVISSDSLVGFAYYQQLLDTLDNNTNIVAVTPVIMTTGLMSVDGASRSEGVDVTGIDAESFCRVTEFEDTLYPDSFVNSSEIFSTGSASPGCIRGIAMMTRRNSNGLYATSLSYKVSLDLSCFPLTSKGTLAKSGTDLVNTKSFTVTNDSNSGLPRIDRSMLYIPFEQAQLLCGMAGNEPRTNALFIKFAPEVRLADGVEEVERLFDEFKSQNSNMPYGSLLDNVRVESWKKYRREAIAPIEKEEIMLTALFVLIGFVTVFVILVVFFLIISHKSRDIGIFKSFGLNTFSVMGIFMRFAVAAGVAGAFVGTAVAILFLRYINDLEGWLYSKYGWQLWDRSMYSIGEIPHDMRFIVAFTIVLFAILASIAGAIVPVMCASLKRPVDILKVSQV
ncbi:MAG: ABC transporter permease [Sedimentisphaeraceae bacterium JB056]